MKDTRIPDTPSNLINHRKRHSKMPFSHPKTKTQTKTSVFLANPNRHCRAAGHGTACEVLDIARTTRPRDAMLDGKKWHPRGCEDLALSSKLYILYILLLLSLLLLLLYYYYCIYIIILYDIKSC